MNDASSANRRPPFDSNRSPAISVDPSAVDPSSVDPSSRAHGSDVVPYVLSVLCGMVAGVADVFVNDLLFTALVVLAACMLLGTLRARAPWRWVIVVVTFIPLTELASYLAMSSRANRAQIYGGFLTALPGVAGAYGGAVMRRAIDNLRTGK